MLIISMCSFKLSIPIWVRNVIKYTFLITFTMNLDNNQKSISIEKIYHDRIFFWLMSWYNYSQFCNLLSCYYMKCYLKPYWRQVVLKISFIWLLISIHPPPFHLSKRRMLVINLFLLFFKVKVNKKKEMKMIFKHVFP